MKIIIMAGGGGTRLWPVSSPDKPKQFQVISGKNTLLQNSVYRLLPDFSWSDIIVATNDQHRYLVQEQLPELPVENIISEPCKRDTAPAIGYLATVVTDDPQETLMFLPADHHISHPKLFRAYLSQAQSYLDQTRQGIITLGIQPSYPETGYGYIQYQSYSTDGVCPVQAFVEKPDYETACRYVESGEYLWNAGMFIVKRGYLQEQFQQFLPEIYQRMQKIGQAKGSQDLSQVIAQEYPQCQALSIDYGILEKSKQVHVIPVDIGWSDIGNWRAVSKVTDSDSVEMIDSTQVWVKNQTTKPIATIGMKDVIIVETEQALIICRADQTHKVKKLSQ